MTNPRCTPLDEMKVPSTLFAYCLMIRLKLSRSGYKTALTAEERQRAQNLYNTNFAVADAADAIMQTRDWQLIKRLSEPYQKD